MRWHTPPENQGQIVTVSYGWCGEALLRRTHDASDRSEVIRILPDPWADATASERAALEDWQPWWASPPDWVTDALDAADVITAGAVLTWEV